MTQPAKGHEPSMEDILASIRRIIADDDPAKSSPNKSSPNTSPPKESVSESDAATAAPRPATLSPRMTPAQRPAPAPEPAMRQAEIDKMLAQLQATSARQGCAPMDEPIADILDLTEQMAAPEQASAPAAGVHTIERQSDLVVEDRAPEPPAPPRAAQEPRRALLDSGERGLVSAATTAAVDSAFNTLTQTVHVQNSRTLEDLVREMLRPMLKTWLDDNLPSMVERLVRAEIERVSRGRG